MNGVTYQADITSIVVIFRIAAVVITGTSLALYVLSTYVD